MNAEILSEEMQKRQPTELVMVLSTMAPKRDRVYARGRSMSIAPSTRMVIGSDDERDPEYVPPGTSTPSRAARAARATPKKEASGSAEVPAPATAAASALSDEADSSESTSGSPAHALTPATDQPNRWCIDGKFQVYSDATFLNDKRVMTRTLTLERRVLTGSLLMMPENHNFFSEHRLEWTALVKDGKFLREPSLIETTNRWIALHLSVDGEGADWVTEPNGAIKKANLTFTAMFLWLIVRHCLSPTTADNIVTRDRALLMAVMIAGFEVDFAWLLQAVMHERDFKVSTTYPFPCMIFSLYRSAGVPIWHVDHLKTPQGTVDVGLIRDEANELAPRRGPRPELPPLAYDLADTVAQARTAMQKVSTDTTPIESIPGSRTAPSSSRTAPLPALVPLARVQKLEVQMATLLHHIQSWMQRSITEAEKRLERKIVQHIERKIAEVHQCLDAFELRVLARPAPPVDVSTLQAPVDSLRADIDTILEARVPESEAPSVEPAEDTVWADLFAPSEIPPPLPREHAKRCRGRADEEARAWKKENCEMEAARRASLEMRAGELAARASNSRTVEIAGGTADSAIVDEDTTEGVQSIEEVDSGEQDPPTW
ncbi:hypothetical protein EJD97_025003 [Solanum chilense]|uniref:Putative plant transposon protein domain-containing protein n=1 Tax=Solanum chilense TaxID=4083 RepID=A0A6N2C8N3_SOLCI|nr:hypothetical protein EJD97_025003 [Solanum chilense]